LCFGTSLEHFLFQLFLVWMSLTRQSHYAPSVCARERERSASARSFLLFWAWEGEIVWGVEDKFCEVLRGSGFDNCGLDLYGVLLAAIQSLGTYHTHCVDSSSVPFRCLVYEVTEYHRFLK
jgi:hypothetical protein